MNFRYNLNEVEVGTLLGKGMRWMYKIVYLSKKNNQHIMHNPIIFSEIDILLLGYKKFNS